MTDDLNDQPSLLVVDDEEAMRVFLERALRRDGCKTAAVSSGREACARMTGGEEFDLVLLSNMLCYMTSHDDLRRACENAWRATRPGGRIALYTPHRGSMKEPFTRLPVIHWLPMGLRERIAVKSGRRTTMRDVRLPSTGELRSIFNGLGAKSIRQSPEGAATLLRTTHIFQWIEK